MTVKTLCRLYKDLCKIRYPTASTLRAQTQIEKMIVRMRPARRHQSFSIALERYVDEGE